MRIPHFIAVLVLACFSSGITGSASTGAVTFPSPANWYGTIIGQSDGNPYLNGDDPEWRLDHIWPADWRDPSNYQPLIWLGKRGWGVAHKGVGEQMNRPSALVIHDGTIKMSAFASRWGGSPPQWGYDRPAFSNKTPALVFIVPESGVYRMNFKVYMKFWTGTGVARVLVLKRQRSDTKVKKIMDEEIADNAVLECRDIMAELNMQDELIVVPWLDVEKSGCDIELAGLTVTKVK